MSEKVKHPVLWATLFTIISLAWVFPIVLVVINSFKQKAYISRNAFSIPTGKAFVGLQNYTRGIKRTNLIESFGWTVVVTVGAVLLILLCTSMCGLAGFIFTGVIKGIPQELEESAMIDGASVPRIFFQITLPSLRPSVISVAILQAMWIWNDFLLPYLTLDMRRFKTMSIAIQYLKGGYGSVDMGAMMGCLVLAIIPIIIFYLVCQKYIIKGVMAGAVKG